MKSKIVKAGLIGIGFFVGISALTVLADWSDPNCGPTGCNTPAPLNVGPDITPGVVSQTKVGSLAVNSSFFNSVGLVIGGKIKIVDDSAVAGTAAGKVLTSDANGVGTWKSAGGGTEVLTGASSSMNLSAGGNWNVTAFIAYSACKDPVTYFKLDGSTVATRSPGLGDPEGCEGITITANVPSVTPGVHTWSATVQGTQTQDHLKYPSYFWISTRVSI